MIVRPYVQTDYETLLEWWEGHGHERLESGRLGSEGFVAEKDDGDLVCASFLIRTSGDFAFQLWTVGDPLVPWGTRAEAIKLLTKTMQSYAGALGFQALFTWSENARLSEKMKDFYDHIPKHELFAKVL